MCLQKIFQVKRKIVIYFFVLCHKLVQNRTSKPRTTKPKKLETWMIKFKEIWYTYSLGFMLHGVLSLQVIPLFIKTMELRSGIFQTYCVDVTPLRERITKIKTFF